MNEIYLGRGRKVLWGGNGGHGRAGGLKNSCLRIRDIRKKWGP